MHSKQYEISDQDPQASRSEQDTSASYHPAVTMSESKTPVSLVKISYSSSQASLDETSVPSSGISTPQQREKHQRKPNAAAISIVVVRPEGTQLVRKPADNVQTSDSQINSNIDNNNDESFRLPIKKDPDMSDIPIEIVPRDSIESFPSLYKQTQDGRLPISFVHGSDVDYSGGEHFEIIWSNLSYMIQPKWYKKINLLDKIFPFGQTVNNVSSATSTVSSSAGMSENQQQMHVSTNSGSQIGSLSTVSKSKSQHDAIEIFSNLNGSIKSGQMTAILGPSGK